MVASILVEKITVGGLPAEPVNAGFETPAQYTFDLDGLQAVRLKTVIGGDYPLGDEAERRITFGGAHGRCSGSLPDCHRAF